MIVGIIAEYNPFHNGHKYQIEYLRKIYNPEGIFIAMSGNYVQRGEAASFDKYTRAKSALSAGADLVFEIPQIFACASARDFARSSVKLLATCGCDTIACGAETPDEKLLTILTDYLSDESVEYKNELNKALKAGFSFPSAREKAVYNHFKDEKISCFLKEPNNLLALEYSLAARFFGCELRVIPIKREKTNHNDTASNGKYSSASYIREGLNNGLNVDNYLPYPDYYDLNNFVSMKDFDSILLDRLISLDDNSYYDINSDLFDRIKNNVSNFTTTSDFINILKAKNTNYSSISRALLRLILGYTKDDAQDYLPYIRLLGMKKEARKLLSSVSSSCEAVGELITSLPKNPSPLLEKHIRNDALYEGIRALKSGTEIQNEYGRKFLVVE